MNRRNFFEKSALLGAYCLFAQVPLSAKAEQPGEKLVEGNSSNSLISNTAAICDKALKKQKLTCDILVAGGGLAGICAAVSAARLGAKVILLQDRSRLGGNSSSEIKMHPLGMHYQNTGFREGGILEEILLENIIKNPQKEWELWDLLLYDKVVSEPNISLFLDTDLCGAAVENNRVKLAYARSDSTRSFYEIKADVFIDCTGDSRLAAEVGAELMSGRDLPETYGESLSGFDPQGTRQGSSIMFTSRDYGRPMPFKAPSWARKITPDMLKFRDINSNNLEYGYWWIELGGNMDAISQGALIRHELLSVILGIWDYIKNSGKFPEAENRALDSIGMLPGRRETFRVRGLYTLTERDIRGNWKNFTDSVAVGGWSMDDHPKEGFDATNRQPCRQIQGADYYNIPLACLISKDIENMMMAGRNISCSHVAFTSTRVMATCASVGQAAGTCAYFACKNGLSPQSLWKNPQLVDDVQQALLRANQAIVGVKNTDPSDLAKGAKISASSSALGTDPKNVANGFAIEFKGERKNRWIAELAAKPQLVLEWEKPVEVSNVEFVLDSGYRELTMSKSNAYLNRMHWGPQPEILRDFNVFALDADGREVLLAKVEGNWRKVLKLKLNKTKCRALIVRDFVSNGDKYARIMSVSVYS